MCENVCEGNSLVLMETGYVLGESEFIHLVSHTNYVGIMA